MSVSAAALLRPYSGQPKPVHWAVRFFGRQLLPLYVLVAAVLIWQWITSSQQSPFWPTPLDIAKNSWELFFTRDRDGDVLTSALRVDAAGTLTRMFTGYAIGAVAGIVLGVATGLSSLFRDFTWPTVEFVRSVPVAATLPLFINVIGSGSSMRITFVAFACTWIVLINTANGVSGIHSTPLLMVRSFRISRLRTLFSVVLPFAMPDILAGLRITLTSSLIIAIVSEFMLASSGVGFQLVNAQARYQLLDMWSWMLLPALAGLAFNALMSALEHKARATFEPPTS